ncbi:MAG: PilN domain-containing protein [Deltaproteobacteria bacterium]|nr:PilN domain-containing protein [Deltaproteobacteria bacterium]
MKITINLATRRLAPANVPYILAFALFIFAAAYSLYNLYDYRINRKELALYKNIASRLEKSLPPEKPSPRGAMDPQSARKKVEAINNIIVRETFSWTGLLSDLEEGVPENISIVEISPQFGDRRITVKGMARSMNDVLNFVARLPKGGRFSDAFLLKHSEEKPGGAPGGSPGESPRGSIDERLFFTVSARYVREGGL